MADFEAHDLVIEQNLEFFPRNRLFLQVEIEEVGRKRRRDGLILWVVCSITAASVKVTQGKDDMKD